MVSASKSRQLCRIAWSAGACVPARAASHDLVAILVHSTFHAASCAPSAGGTPVVTSAFARVPRRSQSSSGALRLRTIIAVVTLAITTAATDATAIHLRAGGASSAISASIVGQRAPGSAIKPRTSAREIRFETYVRSLPVPSRLPVSSSTAVTQNAY